MAKITAKVYTTSAASKFCSVREPTTIDATRRPVTAVAQAPARSCSAARSSSGDSVISSASWRGTNTLRLTTNSAAAVAASSTKPGQTTPKPSRKAPRTRGGKKPPRPPMAPTRPVTVAVSPGKYCGTSLKTAPLPSPSSAAQPSAPTVNGIIEGQASSSAKGTTARKTPESTRAPPIRSASMPPTGRSSVASTTKPAVRNPASAGRRPNWSRRSVGR